MEHLLTQNQVNLAQEVGKYQLPEASQFCGGGFQKVVTINWLNLAVNLLFKIVESCQPRDQALSLDQNLLLNSLFFLNCLQHHACPDSTTTTNVVVLSFCFVGVSKSIVHASYQPLC